MQSSSSILFCFLLSFRFWFLSVASDGDVVVIGLFWWFVYQLRLGGFSDCWISCRHGWECNLGKRERNCVEYRVERDMHNHHKPQSSSPTYVLHFFKEEEEEKKKTPFSQLLLFIYYALARFKFPSLSFPCVCVCKWSPTQQRFIFPFLIEFHNTIAYILYSIHVI